MAAHAAIAAGYTKLGEMQRGAACYAEAERVQQLEEELKKIKDSLQVFFNRAPAPARRLGGQLSAITPRILSQSQSILELNYK